MTGDTSDPGPEIRELLEGLGTRAMTAQLDQAGAVWAAMIDHAGALNRQAKKLGFGRRASRRLGLAFVAKCLGGGQ